MKAKKQFGQHFLTRDHYAKVMCAAAHISAKDTVIEIGPGKGVLTAVLLGHARRVIAIEKDPDLIPLLAEKFHKEITAKKLIVVQDDVLNFESSPNTLSLGPLAYKLVANIPYYITGNILRHFLSETLPPKSITIMVQKEVAERICTTKKKETLLSLSVKAYGTPHIVSRVSAGNFSPKPKVDSAIIHIDHISKEFFKHSDEKKFFDILHAGFAHKRKVLLRNLDGFDKTLVKKVFAKLNIPEKIRAEDLTLAAWQKLAELL